MGSTPRKPARCGHVQVAVATRWQGRPQLRVTAATVVRWGILQKLPSGSLKIRTSAPLTTGNRINAASFIHVTRATLLTHAKPPLSKKYAPCLNVPSPRPRSMRPRKTPPRQYDKSGKRRIQVLAMTVVMGIRAGYGIGYR